jgi:hypothetical protein
MAKFLGGVVPLELLHSMETVLQRYRERLFSCNLELTERSKTLEAQIAQLDGLSRRWKATLQLPDLLKAAPEIPERVETLIELIGRTRQAAEARRERDSTLQGHVLEAAARLQAVAPAFERAEASAVKTLFVQDSPPLWSLGVEQWREAIRAPLIPPASAALLTAYLRHDRTILYLHAAIVLFLALSLFWLRRWVQKWTDEEPNLRGAANVFDLPVSTAVTLSFLVVGSIYSTAPFLLRAILWGLLLISIVLILRRLIDRALFPILNALIVLYLVDQFAIAH